jgi:hypothetical protein
MTDPATGQRSFFQALRVPFDLAGVALGAMALVLTHFGLSAAGWSFRLGVSGEDGPTGISVLTGGTLAEVLLGFAVAAFILLVFGVAMCRVAGMRIARDEGVPLADALGFALRGLPQSVGAVLFSAGSVAAVWGLVAAGGWLASLDGIGPFLGIVLLPLACLGTLILLLLAWGSVVGAPLVLPALAVERNGALDAVSRSYSYCFSRPALYAVHVLTVAFLGAVLYAVTGIAERMLVVEFTRFSGEGGSAASEAFRQGAQAAFSLALPPAGAAGAAMISLWWGWAMALVFHLCFLGWVVYYVFGGATAAYVALRRDVDGTEDEEIWLEGEQGDSFGAPEEPVPPSAAGASGGAAS